MVRMLAFMPLATPVWCAGTDAITTEALVEITSPVPRPWAVMPIISSSAVLWSSASAAYDAAETSAPVRITERAPNRPISRAVKKPTVKLATAEGSSSRPDSVMEAPKP